MPLPLWMFQEWLFEWTAIGHLNRALWHIPPHRNARERAPLCDGSLIVSRFRIKIHRRLPMFEKQNHDSDTTSVIDAKSDPENRTRGPNRNLRIRRFVIGFMRIILRVRNCP